MTCRKQTGNLLTYTESSLVCNTSYNRNIRACNQYGCSNNTSLSINTSDCSINGACGSANEQTFTSIPTSNLCSAGATSSISGTGPWTWTCNGQNGGSDASCSANIQTYSLSVKVINDKGGSINILGKTIRTSDSVNVKHGETITFTVTPDSNYKVSNVSFYNTLTSSNNTYTISVTSTPIAILSATFIIDNIPPQKSSTQPTLAACETFCYGYYGDINININVIAYGGIYFNGKGYNCGCYNSVDENNLRSLGSNISNITLFRTSNRDRTLGSIIKCTRCSHVYNNEKVTFDTFDNICDSFTLATTTLNSSITNANVTYVTDNNCGTNKILGIRLPQ